MTEETYEDAALILRRTKYYSGVFEREISEANGVTTEREINFIFAPDGLAAIYEKKNGTGNMYYVSTDNLGSINIIADAQGNIVNDLGYDAWGRRHNPYTWEQLTVAQTKALQPTLITDRGYTLHEHIDAFGLINMNGRAYDPLVGQFLSPDPFVQSSTSAQSYNRYSYCWNNPLKFVDPSGYYTIDIDGLIFQIHNDRRMMHFIGDNWDNIVSMSSNFGWDYTWGYFSRNNSDSELGTRGGQKGIWFTQARSVGYPCATQRLENDGNIDGDIVGTFDHTTIELINTFFSFSEGINRYRYSENRFELLDNNSDNLYEGDKKNIKNNLGPYTSWIGVIGQAGNLSANVPVYNYTTRMAQINAEGSRVIGTIGKTSSYIGWTGEALSLGINGYNVYNNPTAGNWGRLGVSVVTTSLNFVPVVGPLLSFGVSVIDASGGFDGFYDWLDEQQ